MKTMLALLCLLSLSAHAKDRTLSEIQGTYKVKPSRMPGTNVIEVNADGTLVITLKLLGKTYVCPGPVKIENNILISDVVCKSGEKLGIEMDLSDIKSIDKFNAPVRTSILGEVTFQFTKIK